MKPLVVAGLLCWQLALCGCAAVMSAAATHSVAISAAAQAAPLVLAVGAVGAIGIAGAMGDQRMVHEPGTLGAFLQENRAAVRVHVQDAMKIQREAEVVAGLEIQMAIARAYFTFRENLDVKVTAIGEAERNFIAEIGPAIASLSGGVNQEIKRAGDRARAIADRLRPPGDVPLVRSYGPIFLFPFLPFQSINVGGRFPAEYPNGVIPQLTVNGKAYKAFSYDTQTLAFSLPTADLDAMEPEAIVWRTAELAIPWNKPLFDSFARAGFENFVVIAVLPHAFGRATIEHRTSTSRREDAVITSEAFDLAWGSSRVFPYPPGTWKLRYSKFGGGPAEVATTDVANPFVRVNADERGVTIRTYPF